MLSRHLQRNIWKAVPSFRPTIFKQAPKAGPYALRSFSGSVVKHNASTVETLSPTGGKLAVLLYLDRKSVQNIHCESGYS